MPAEKQTVLIERLVDEDYLEVVELFKYIGKDYVCNPDLPQTKKVFDEYLAGERKRGIVARIDTRVTGVFLFEITPTLSRRHTTARGEGMAVHPLYRGRGIGKALLRTVEEICNREQPTNLQIRASDPRVITLYRSMTEFEERGVSFIYTPIPSMDI